MSQLVLTRRSGEKLRRRRHPLRKGERTMRLNVKQWEEIRNFARVMRENKLGAIDMTIEATSLAELRAANARLQAWHDAVMGQPSFTNKHTYIRRPQPLAKE